MTAPDPRVGEIEARLEPVLFHGPYVVDGRKVIQANNHPSISPYTLSDSSMPVIAEFIANAPSDVAYLLAELRKAHEALADAWDEGGRAATGTYDTGYPSRNPYRAAVAAANGGGRG